MASNEEMTVRALEATIDLLAQQPAEFRDFDALKGLCDLQGKIDALLAQSAPTSFYIDNEFDDGAYERHKKHPIASGIKGIAYHAGSMVLVSAPFKGAKSSVRTAICSHHAVELKQNVIVYDGDSPAYETNLDYMRSRHFMDSKSDFPAHVRTYDDCVAAYWNRGYQNRFYTVKFKDGDQMPSIAVESLCRLIDASEANLKEVAGPDGKMMKPRFEIVVIDYLDRLTTANKNNFRQENEVQEYVINYLRRWLNKTGRMAYCFSQYSKDGIRRRKDGKEDGTGIGGSIKRVTAPDYVTSIVKNEEAMVTNWSWDFLRNGTQPFVMTYEYKPVRPILMPDSEEGEGNQRGVLLLKDIRTASEVRKEKENEKSEGAKKIARYLHNLFGSPWGEQCALIEGVALPSQSVASGALAGCVVIGEDRLQERLQEMFDKGAKAAWRNFKQHPENMPFHKVSKAKIPGSTFSKFYISWRPDNSVSVTKEQS